MGERLDRRLNPKISDDVATCDLGGLETLAPTVMQFHFKTGVTLFVAISTAGCFLRRIHEGKKNPQLQFV